MASKRGRPKKAPDIKELLNKYIPTADIFNDDEKKMYDGLVSVYLEDFDAGQLTANDMDDIISIAMNRVLEIRLLKTTKDNPDRQLDASAAIERLRKQTDKLKDSLAARRKDRIDPKKYSGFSIVDLAIAFDSNKKQELLDRSLKMKQEEDEVFKKQGDLLVGNRLDEDAQILKDDS
ncbi:MAG: hypothetical protein DRO67_06750 [Candidatus Asgardarchaeum californiense]|nr:MAG: hypothetical protein DRO67_06750 [Candidatus Asgardarchaeum californiense]